MGSTTDDGAAGAPGVAADPTGTLITTLGEMLNRAPDSISENSRLFEDLSFDSTGVLELLLLLEDEFGVEFDPEALELSDFETVRSLAGYVLRQAAEA